MPGGNMASAEQVGNIVYEVEMNVARLIEAQQQVNKRLDQMDSKFEQSSRSAGRFEGALNKVGVAIAAAFTIDAAKKLIAIGDEMVTLQARIARLSPSIDVAKETLASLSAIAAQTGNSLSETERLWESLTTALKETGATNSQILVLTSTLQKLARSVGPLLRKWQTHCDSSASLFLAVSSVLKSSTLFLSRCLNLLAR
jgi:chromosome segregation ATPase